MKATICLFNETELEVEYTYHKETQPVYRMHGGDPGYPGSESEFEIHSVRYKRTDVTDLLLPEYKQKIIENLIL